LGIVTCKDCFSGLINGLKESYNKTEKDAVNNDDIRPRDVATKSRLPLLKELIKTIETYVNAVRL